jgi:dephospho-CoA kinase
MRAGFSLMRFLLGLTGNIGCGKSTVGQLLAERYGAEYLDADRVVHGLYAAGTPETLAIAERFGADLLKPDGTIDRRRLGDIVMADPDALKELERLLAPGIRRAIDQRLAASTAAVVVLDAIRLIEGGMAARCDAVWVVTCEREAQIERLQASRHMTAEQAALRVDAQAAAAEKLRYATEVIRNLGSFDDLERRVTEAWDRSVAGRGAAGRD